MHWWQALILGIVEGVTEYLPVSSTGHLILAQRAMGIGESEAADAYAIVIQAGAILAVFGLYFSRFKQMARGLLLNKDPEGKRLAINILIAFAVTAVFALTLEKPVKAHLFGIWPVVAAWFVGGMAILIVSQWRPAGQCLIGPGREMNQLTRQQAAIIGLVQVIAMWPGTSRSLVTIVAGVLMGLGLGAAVEFSFLLGVVTLTAATAHEVLKYHHVMLHDIGWRALAIGFIAALIFAALAVEWMVNYLKRHGLSIFGWYRVALAIVVAALLLAGVLRQPPAG